MVTRPATAAFKFMSAFKLSTSSSMRPTDRLGTFKSTSGGVEASESLLLVVRVVEEFVARVVEAVGAELVDGGAAEIEGAAEVGDATWEYVS